MRAFKYGDMVGTCYIHPDISYNLGALMAVVHDLQLNGLEFIAFNEEGIVVKDDDKIIDRIKHLNHMITNLDLGIMPESTSVKDVTSEFYLLFDMLPEHIKKEIKIYIKNGK